jgi:cell division protein ZapA
MDSGSDRKSVRVTIFNQSYTLVATEEPGEVETLAHSVDELMTDIAQRAGNVDSNRVAVLACLHLADRLRAMERELSDLKARVDQKTRQFSMLLEQAAETKNPR